MISSLQGVFAHDEVRVQMHLIADVSRAGDLGRHGH